MLYGWANTLPYIVIVDEVQFPYQHLKVIKGYKQQPTYIHCVIYKSITNIYQNVYA